MEQTMHGFMKRLFLISVLLTFGGEANKIDNQFGTTRDLATCSSYADGGSCNNYSNCNFLNNGGVVYDTTSLMNQEFDKDADFSYGNGLYKDDEYIYMSQVDFSADLYAHSNSSSTLHPLCEWRLLFRTNFDIYIDITRDSLNYEEFYMYTNTNKEANYYYSKYFSSCNSSTYRITLSNTGYVRLKILQLNDASNYQITVSQPYKASYDWTAVILSIGGVTICISLIILILLIWCAYRMYKTSANQNRVGILPEQRKKLEFIAKCLDNMRSGKFCEMDLKFEENACVICLDEYVYDSIVGITNEGEHVFHSKGLDEWFRNIRGDKDLVCPHCNTVITDTSQRPQLRCVDISNSGLPHIENELNTVNGTTNNMITHQMLRSINMFSRESEENEEEEVKENEL